MVNTSPVQFAKQVRQEATKVAWPTRKETAVSTAMVFVMVVIVAAFFGVVDWVLGHGVRLLFRAIGS